ncbi:MAG TPA: class I SAM-dependent methyltransferase [Gemmataceae bacterium]|jgi:SAM-dependent methyltransferase|nr:class I SAM-dependent methyltransferase [Gemmataceae bacterium]
MNATDRLESERLFHDHQARHRAEHFRRQPGQLFFRDGEYLDHESWIRPALDRLGDVGGKQVLDYGCGHGMAAVALARRGAQVIAFDLSADYLAEARRRALANSVTIEFVQADAHHLPFADAVFDAIWGNAILHHLDLTMAGREIYRVLRPGGVAVFCEPWGGNPFLAWGRRWLPYPGKGRTRDEQPLTVRDLAALREIFPNLEFHGFQLFSMLHRILGKNSLVTALERCDDWLLRRMPGLAHWCRYAMIVLRR